ncbi:hypothetical protein ACSBR2_026557 [Camellia fascicularis]
MGIPYCQTQHGGTYMEKRAKIPANKEVKLPCCSSLYCASGIIYPSLPQFISIAAASSFALGATLNTLVFPQLGRCDVFVYVSCAQTALLDSKEFLSPVITPFEAMIAFSRGSQWTGAYVMEFHNLMTSFPMELRDHLEEARFSFLQGGYVEDFELEETNEENEDGTLALVKATEKALQVSNKDPKLIIKGTAKSGTEYLASRSYHGLDIQMLNGRLGSCCKVVYFLLVRTGNYSIWFTPGCNKNVLACSLCKSHFKVATAKMRALKVVIVKTIYGVLCNFFGKSPLLNVVHLTLMRATL